MKKHLKKSMHPAVIVTVVTICNWEDRPNEAACFTYRGELTEKQAVKRVIAELNEDTITEEMDRIATFEVEQGRKAPSPTAARKQAKGVLELELMDEQSFYVEYAVTHTTQEAR